MDHTNSRPSYQQAIIRHEKTEDTRPRSNPWFFDAQNQRKEGKESGYIGFAANGEKELPVIRNGKLVYEVFPKDRLFLEPLK